MLFISKSRLKVDVVFHRDDQPYSCGRFGKPNTHPSLLVKNGPIAPTVVKMSPHQAWSHKYCILERSLKCLGCGKGFALSRQLKMHYRVHSGEKPYMCKDCGKCFPQPFNLKCHQIQHTGIKPHRCSDCGKAFTLSNLVQHWCVQTEEKSYHYLECWNIFSVLKEHKRVHSGEKVYCCSDCKEDFARLCNLKETPGNITSNMQ